MSLERLRFSQEEDREEPPAERARRACERLDRVPAARNDCAAGCAFCCHLLVEVTPSEAARIAGHVRDRAAVEENAGRAEGLSAAEYRRARLRCAFLDAEDRCSIYDVRPLACRAHTSRDRHACQRASLGELTTNELPTDRWLAQAADALRRGMDEPGGELHRAVVGQLPPAICS